MIQNYNGGGNYSLNEQVIGTQVNGKPLYRKVIQPNISTPTAIISSILYVGKVNLSDYISNVDMAFVDITKSYYMPNINETRGFISTWYEKDTGELCLMTLYSRNNVDCYIVVEYTKTTD